MSANRLKLVFMGTSYFAIPSLKRLIDSGYNIALTVSQPDKKKGRKRVLAPSPVKVEANINGLKLYQPENVNDDDSSVELNRISPDVIVVVAYGQILSGQVLKIPKFGCINIHGSLLPELRGAAPINWAIVNGYKKTGVTSILMDEGTDTGDILLKSETEIDDEIDSVALSEKLSEMGGELLINTLDKIESGKLERRKQDEKNASFAPIIKKSDGIISFKEKDAKEIHNMVRGFKPWPEAQTFYNGNSLKLLSTSYNLDDDTDTNEPGTVIMVTKKSFFVAAKRGMVEVFSLKPQNKREMKAADFINGYGLKAGAVLRSSP